MEGRTSATDIIVVTEHDTVCSNRVYAGKGKGSNRVYTKKGCSGSKFGGSGHQISRVLSSQDNEKKQTCRHQRVLGGMLRAGSSTVGRERES